MTARPFSPWPISIVALFAIFIGGLIAFIVFATRQRDDLVRADYYEQEIRYQEHIDRINRTQDSAPTAAVRYDAREQRITIELPTAHVQGSSGQVHLYRPADARLDRQLPLAVGTDGVQHLDARDLRAGLWKVRVEWSVAGEEFFIDRSVVLPES